MITCLKIIVYVNFKYHTYILLSRSIIYILILVDYILILVDYQGSVFPWEKPVFPGTVGKTWDKPVFPVLPRFKPGKTWEKPFYIVNLLFFWLLLLPLFMKLCLYC